MLLNILTIWYILSVGIICYQESKVGWPCTPYKKLLPFTIYHMALATCQLVYILPMWYMITAENRHRFVWDQIAWNFRLLFTIWWGRIKWKGLENVPDTQAIWVGNHQSTMDMAIMTMLPCRTPMVGTSKDSIKYIPGSGLLVMLCGTILIKKGNENCRQKFHDDCVDALRKGNSVNIFPQGTRRYKNSLSLKRGAFDLAVKEGMSIIPYKIDYTKGVSVTIYPSVKIGEDNVMEKVQKILL